MKKYHIQLPPQHSLAEEILLGGILINPNVITLATIELSIDYFAIEEHQLIYRTIIQIYTKHKYIDAIILINTLWEINLLYEAGGIKKILALIKQAQIFIPKSINNKSITYYITILKDKYFRRLLIQYGYYIIKLAHVYNISQDIISFKADKYLSQIKNLSEYKSSQEIKYIITNFLLGIKSHNFISQEKSIMSGFKEVDKIIDGFKNSDLIVIAGRPSMGKTSLGLSIVNNIITSSNTKIGIFSLETSKEQILYKLLSISSKISLKKLITGNINNSEWLKIQQVSTNIINSIGYIDDTANLSISQLNSKAKFLKNKNNQINLVMIDYLQLIQSEDLLSSSRSEELSIITRTLKILAKDLCIPIIVLSQLNRNVESRVNKKPLLSDLRESGCIGYYNFSVFNKQKYLHSSYTAYLIKHSASKNILLFTNKIHLEENLIEMKKDQYNYTIQNIYSEIVYCTHNHRLLTQISWQRNDRLKYFSKIQFIAGQTNKKILFLDEMGDIFLDTKEIVYDIAMNEFTSFTSNNGLILHNSIEQDADLVLLLYREAYYNQNTKNITEIIIAKHRNGPTGTAELNFNTELATFENKSLE